MTIKVTAFCENDDRHRQFYVLPPALTMASAAQFVILLETGTCMVCEGGIAAEAEQVTPPERPTAAPRSEAATMVAADKMGLSEESLAKVEGGGDGGD